MKTVTIGLVRFLLRLNFFAAVLTMLFVAPIRAEEIPLDVVKSKIAGLYTLEEWQKDGKLFTPPQVDGRFILMNGVIMTVLHNRMQSSSHATTILVGKYELNADKFSYGYDDVSIFTESADATSVSHNPFWDGMRAFTISVDGDVVRFREDNGAHEFVFIDEGLTYFEKGKVLRKWRRTTDKR